MGDRQAKRSSSGAQGLVRHLPAILGGRNLTTALSETVGLVNAAPPPLVVGTFIGVNNAVFH
jgi:hypothetical protein